MRLIPLAIAATALLAITPARATNIYVTTGTGPDTAVISDGNPLSWTFTAMPPYTSFQGGVFAMSMAAGTSYGIRMELFDVSNGALIDFITLSADDVAAAGGNALSYERIVFDLPVAFTASDNYQITLSVTDNPLADPDTGSYTVRGTLGMFQFVEEEVPTAIMLATGPASVETPEPAAALVMAAALLGLAGTRRRAA